MPAEPLSDERTIPSRLPLIEEARQWLTAHSKAAGFDEEGVWEIELALTEALANVIEHAYERDPDCEIRLAVAIDDERLAITITDFGRGFDESAYAVPDLNVPRASGYGVHLIEQLMDEVVREASPGENRLSLVKYRKERPHG